MDKPVAPAMDDALVEVTQDDIAAGQRLLDRQHDMLRRQGAEVADATVKPDGMIVQALAQARLAGVKEGLEMAAIRFERAIQDGYQSPADPHDRCEHGHGSHDDCIACYDDALAVAIANIRSLGPRP